MDTLKITEKENVIKFETQFIELLKSTSKDKGIIYIWKTEKKIPRVCGASDILYIGKTKQSLNDRYNNAKSLDIEKDYFKNVYKHVIEKYGAISIDVIVVNLDELKVQEAEKINDYYESHKELPPLNRNKPISNQPKKEQKL